MGIDRKLSGIAPIKFDRQALLRMLDGDTVEVVTEVGPLKLAPEQIPWVPLQKVTDEAVKARRRFRLPEFDMWRNEEYEVIVTDHDAFTQLQIKRYDRAPAHNWRHLQQIKNEIMGDEAEAVELYPAESRLADTANHTHLWVSKQGRLPFGFPHGSTLSEAQVETFNRMGRGRQEPQQPGTTVGNKLRGVGKHAIPEVEEAKNERQVERPTG